MTGFPETAPEGDVSDHMYFAGLLSRAAPVGTER